MTTLGVTKSFVTNVLCFSFTVITEDVSVTSQFLSRFYEIHRQPENHSLTHSLSLTVQTCWLTQVKLHPYFMKFTVSSKITQSLPLPHGTNVLVASGQTKPIFYEIHRQPENHSVTLFPSRYKRVGCLRSNYTHILCTYM